VNRQKGANTKANSMAEYYTYVIIYHKQIYQGIMAGKNLP